MNLPVNGRPRIEAVARRLEGFYSYIASSFCVFSLEFLNLFLSILPASVKLKRVLLSRSIYVSLSLSVSFLYLLPAGKLSFLSKSNKNAKTVFYADGELNNEWSGWELEIKTCFRPISEQLLRKCWKKFSFIIFFCTFIILSVIANTMSRVNVFVDFFFDWKRNLLYFSSTLMRNNELTAPNKSLNLNSVI